MAHPNELEFLRQYLVTSPVPETGRVLNVGTGDHAHALDYRPLFPGWTMLGIDAQPGEHVDVVCDLTGDGRELADQQFDAVLCCSVLEHCANPWKAADLLTRVLAPGGLLYLSVPWIWRYHAYPKDYWRMSVDGIHVLFPGITWERTDYLSQVFNEVVPQAQASNSPWRVTKGPRVYLCSQMLCMIGRKA